MLVGIEAQGFVSKAIKLGSVLRFQPWVARIATIVQLQILLVTGAWIVDLNWDWLPSIGVGFLGFLLSCVGVWVVATIGKQKNAYWARYSHTALVVSVLNPETRRTELMLAEALSKGVSYSPISKYAPSNYTILPNVINDNDLLQIHMFVGNVIGHKTKYGFVTFVTLFIYCVTASMTFLPTLILAQSGTAICSGFVCDALVRAGFIWDREPYWMMPANIAAHYGVE